MPPVQLIGRTTDFKGKSLWEIIANLKNFGKDRIIIRNRLQRYPEPCFIKILKVAALPADKLDRKVAVLVEKTHRGKTELRQIDGATYKTDYQLVPKDEEYKYLQPVEARNFKLLSKTMELPPVLREIVVRGLKAKGQKVDKEPEMEVMYNLVGETKCYQVVEEGEKYDFKPSIGLGPTKCPGLYANVKPI